MKFLSGVLLILLSNVIVKGYLIPSRKDGGSRIVGGIPIPLTEAPYQVSLLYGNYHTCGG